MFIGGVFDSCQLTLTNCLFWDNEAGYGGAVELENTTTTVTNCTFVNNRSRYGTNGGAGILHGAAYSIYPLKITSSVFWNNRGPGGSTTEADQVYPWAQETEPVIDINHNTIQGLTGAFGGVGNIGVAPLFVDEGNGDLHLRANSPCIDAGDPNGDYSGQTDMDGERRVVNGRVDMGADERPPCGYGLAPLLPMMLGVLGLFGWVRRKR